MRGPSAYIPVSVPVGEGVNGTAVTANTAFMRRDMGMMNQNVGRPMSMMNEFAPW